VGLNTGQRVEIALEVVDQLGGQARVVQRDGRTFIKGAGCPLADLVLQQPIVCRAIRAALSTILDQPLRECCEHAPRPSCCFELP
jgi:hypothetical protein